MAALPFLLNFDPHPFYNPDVFPNSMYRRLHARQHHPLDMHTMGLISRLAPHFRHLETVKHKDDLIPVDGGLNHKDEEFSVHLDVGLFRPDELNVKVVNDHLIIEAKHEERETDDSGYISRHFVRRYELPKDCDQDAIVSKLTADGVLSVMLPKSKVAAKERVIPIQQTGPNDLFLKNKTHNEDKEKSSNNKCDD
ncbi:heat shock protein 67B3 [Stomoxys calcitrans]|uniref:SHSP domain-containing protein n=1 Tax=Stomoxys calcitrans TaxID=35570 RepID=A0A1I8PIM5_STOCA|nr:heat shock protein 67B3 [Stomoxys calcitrans]